MTPEQDLLLKLIADVEQIDGAYVAPDCSVGDDLLCLENEGLIRSGQLTPSYRLTAAGRVALADLTKDRKMNGD